MWMSGIIGALFKAKLVEEIEYGFFWEFRRVESLVDVVQADKLSVAYREYLEGMVAFFGHVTSEPLPARDKCDTALRVWD